MGLSIVPELAVADPAAARHLLAQQFGFVARGDHMVLGDQSIALLGTDHSPTHGKIDHLALAVPDVDRAAAQMMANGAQLEATTPNGAQEIAEFWETGVRYIFLAGPEGARIELISRRGGDIRPGLPGHDHLGIPCSDIAASTRFFADLGLQPIAAVDLIRPDGVTEVRFLQAGASVVELYSPPSLRGTTPAFPTPALWNALHLVGSDLPKGDRIGPDGLILRVL